MREIHNSQKGRSICISYVENVGIIQTNVKILIMLIIILLEIIMMFAAIGRYPTKKDKLRTKKES